MRGNPLCSRLLFPLLSLAPLLLGCRNDGPPDLEDPQGAVRFPAAASQTDAPELTVTGTASDDRGVAVVRVNGTLATSSDGFATWSARVPLTLGDNRLRVEILDGAGNRVELGERIDVARVGSLLAAPGTVALDEVSGQVFVADTALDAVVSIDLLTGARALVSGAARGSGPALRGPAGIALGVAGELLVVDSVAATLFGVDRNTGDRRTIAGGSVGSGPGLQGALALGADIAAGRVYVLIGFPAAILAVELSSGDRTVVSDASRGSGPGLGLRRGLAFDAGRGRLYTVGASALLAVDLTGGDREELALAGDGFSNPTALALDPADSGFLLVSDVGLSGLVEVDLLAGTGTARVAGELVFPLGLALERDGGRALLVDSGLDALLAYDRAIPSVAILSRSGFGAGEPFSNPRDLVLDESGAGVLVVDSQRGLFRVDLASGARTVLSGSGSPFAVPVALDLQTGSGRVLVVDSHLAALFAVEIATGERTVLDGAGPALSLPTDVAWDRAGGRALVLDGDLDAVVAVDPGNGDRTILSDATRGAGPAFDQPRAIACDPEGGRAFVVDAGLDALLEVSLASGDRTVVAAGGAFDEPSRIAWDGANRRLLLVERGRKELIAIDPSSGEQRVLTSPARGAGPAWVAPQGVACDDTGANLLLLDSGLAALLAVEEESGDRVLRSK